MRHRLLLLAILFLSAAPAWAQLPSITLDWTAPGDDGMVGTASTYQLRWSTTRPDTTSAAAMDSWWASATQVAGLPVPLPAGSAQSVTIARSWEPGSYYFVLKACDEVPNCSAYSNVARKDVLDTSPPGRVADLRTR